MGSYEFMDYLEEVAAITGLDIDTLIDVFDRICELDEIKDGDKQAALEYVVEQRLDEATSPSTSYGALIARAKNHFADKLDTVDVLGRITDSSVDKLHGGNYSLAENDVMELIDKFGDTSIGPHTTYHIIKSRNRYNNLENEEEDKKIDKK